MSIDDSLPNDVATLQSMLVAERAARLAAQSEAQSHVRRAADTIDAADLAFELIGGGNVLLADDVIDKGADNAGKGPGVVVGASSGAANASAALW